MDSQTTSQKLKSGPIWRGRAYNNIPLIVYTILIAIINKYIIIALGILAVIPILTYRWQKKKTKKNERRVNEWNMRIRKEYTCSPRHQLMGDDHDEWWWEH